MKNKLIEMGLAHKMEIEVFESKDDKTEINILNDTLKSFEISNTSTYMIKALKDKRCAKVITEDLNPEEIIESLEEIFSIQDNENENRLSSGTIKNVLEERTTLDYESVKKDLFSLNDLKKEYPLINSIEASFGHYESGTYINNTDADLQNEVYFNQFMVSITMQIENTTKIVYSGFYEKDYDFNAFYEYVKKKLDRLVIKMKSTSCKTSKYNVILQNSVVTDLLSTFISMFNTKNIELKESILQDRFATKVFSDKLTIKEDPMKTDAIINEPFDNEGTKTTTKNLIDKGVFAHKINNLEYAIKTGSEPTGNAGGVTNLYIAPGDYNFDELVEKMENGIIIDEAYGFHSGVDIKSGNISLQAEGLVVEDKKIVKGLNMIILSTNLFELFNNIKEIASDMSQTDLNVTCPSILFENITIAGEENE